MEPKSSTDQATSHEASASEQRKDSTPFEALQPGNRTWWTANTMSYDWKDKIKQERFTLSWFDEVTRRLPHLRLKAGQPFEFARNTSFRVPTALHLEWDTTC